jgi:bifunctional enzyme CysN/CysC
MSIEELLKRNREADLLRFTTAGSVDDGKSTLIGRLLNDCKCIYEDHLAAVHADSRRLNREGVDLALLTDGLKAEREQGITIDVAYRYFSTPKRRFIIADTPGHEQYTRNMVTGASTANLAIVLIDARQGVLTQSKRHGFIASLLGIPHVVVAVNKMDLVDYSRDVYEEIRATYDAFTTKLRVTDLIYIPVSALHGDNVVRQSERMPWYDGPPLLSHLENVYIGGDRNFIDFRFPVQYVNRPSGEFRGYCGQIASGVVRVGDEVLALPSGQQSRVSRIVTFDGDREYAFPPESVTLCLEDEIDLSRGDLLAHPRNLPRLERDAEAMVVWMDQEPFRPHREYLVKQTTRTVRAVFGSLQYRVDPNDLHREEATELGLNEIGRVTMELFQPLMCDEYAQNRKTGSFIIIDPMSNRTVGAGMLIERARHKGSIPSATAASQPVSRNITREASLVSTEDRQRVLRQRPATLWFTGLSGSGKSTLAKALEQELLRLGHAAFVLDGDNVRHGLNRDLGFSAEDRTENIRRVAQVARLMNDAGLIVLTSFISPYRDDREAAREVIGGERFVEVFVDAPLSICEERDPKGLYRKARAGEIESFTGVSAPYEPPADPELHLRSAVEAPDALVSRILDCLRRRGVLSAPDGQTS